MKQHSNTTGSLAFNGQDNSNKPGGYNSKLQHTATGVPKAKSNYGRGPTKVGSGSTEVTGTKPPVSATGKAQYRGVGGTTVDCCKENINMGRGPTKGNQQ